MSYGVGIPNNVVQVQSTNFSAVATGTTAIPFDDTIPQITEGTEFMTQAIIPKATGNTLLIEATVTVSSSQTGGAWLSAALFQDSTANALAATAIFQVTATGQVVIPLRHKMTAGTTSSTTFRIRAGHDGTGTMTFNGTGAARRFGGITVSNLTVTEFKA